MATIKELLAKIDKAKKNTLMPEALKKKYIETAQTELHSHPDYKAYMEKQFGKEFMASKDKGAKKTYTPTPDEMLKFENKVIKALEDLGEMSTSDAQGVLEAHSELYDEMYGTNTPIQVAKAILAKGEKAPSKPAAKMEKKKAAPKKAEPAKPAGKKGVDYDCDELIEKEKARQKSSKKSAAKSPAKKSGDVIEKTGEAIEKKAEEGELTKEQILQLIQKFKKEIRRLEKLLKTAK